jgi:CRISPR-associated protein Cmr6
MIPVYRELSEIQQSCSGNFGLWYNKHISIDERSFKLPQNAVSIFKNNYARSKNSDTHKTLLEAKHMSQYRFIKSMAQTHESVVFQATLKSSLLTGSGESHPNEISMKFEHNLGLPFIPASSIKGALRYACLLNAVLDSEGFLRSEFENDDQATLEKVYDRDDLGLKAVFGSQNTSDSSRGQAIILDAYPITPPELAEDILNPHYGKYYGGNHPPSDNDQPIPVKFLTVAKGTVFMFRALIPKKHDIDSRFQAILDKGFRRALEERGIGAKTAVGHGLFSVESGEWDHIIEQENKERAKKEAAELKKENPLQYEVQKLRVMTVEQRTQNIIQYLNDPKKTPEFFIALKALLMELGEWKVKKNKKKKYQRKLDIEARCNA